MEGVVKGGPGGLAPLEKQQKPKCGARMYMVYLLTPLIQHGPAHVGSLACDVSDPTWSAHVGSILHGPVILHGPQHSDLSNVTVVAVALQRQLSL